MPNNEFDAYKDNYTETVEKSVSFSGLSHDFFLQSKAFVIQEILDSRLKDHSCMKLLDVGCGVGALHAYLKNMFETIDGVDVSKESIDRATTEHPNNSYIEYDGNKLPFDDAQFDMVLAVCVMHHVPPAQWDNFMSELERVTAINGIVCLIEHNPINPATRLSVARCPFDEDAVLIGTKKMRSYMKSAGLVNVEIKNFVFFPSNHSGFRAIEKRLSWLPFGAQYAAVGKKNDSSV